VAYKNWSNVINILIFVTIHIVPEFRFDLLALVF
jgi:hypothetical protein